CSLQRCCASFWKARNSLRGTSMTRIISCYTTVFVMENLKSDIEKLKRQKLKHPDIYLEMDNLFGRNPVCEFQGLEEADYKGRVWSQLFEVLAPLAHACGTQYEYRDPIEPPAHKTYLERLKADKSKLGADALLPHQIIAYVHHWDFGKVAELQWNAMDSVEVSIASGLLVSQLSQEPWKGKVINYHEDSPQLELIQGGHDLRYKYEFAAKRNLKPEQMVKKEFVFNHPGFKRFVEVHDWKYIYNNIKSEFEDKGTMTVLTGFSNKLLKLLLENDGEFGHEHVMEVAISGDEFQSLAVVD
ncbi:unnamed protein product, partial [Prunus brigantina]